MYDVEKQVARLMREYIKEKAKVNRLPINNTIC